MVTSVTNPSAAQSANAGFGGASGKNTDDTSAGTDAKIGAGTNISSDFQTFLKMLTAQINNQDPMEPMDSTDFAVQLATFSGVEQQVKTNDLLTSLSSDLASSDMTKLASMVGMDARAVTAGYFDGSTPITLQSDPPAGAYSAYVAVYNQSGTLVDRMPVDKTSQQISWNGVTSDGTQLEPGNYKFNLESYTAIGEQIDDKQMPVYSEITEARNENGTTMLVLAGGTLVAQSDIDALRMPQQISAN